MNKVAELDDFLDLVLGDEVSFKVNQEESGKVLQYTGAVEKTNEVNEANEKVQVRTGLLY